MKYNIKNSLVLVVIITASFSCNKPEYNQPGSDDPSIPADVTNIQVENRAGKAKITYTVPSDKALQYVMAEYVNTAGTPSEAKASYYVDSLIVDGFADTTEHDVTLYSVSRTGVKSKGTVVKVKPTEAEIFKIFRSLRFQNNFGGFDLIADNPGFENIGIMVLNINKFKEYEVDNNLSVFTNQKNIISKIRGMDTITKRLGFYVTDRWNNRTDTVFANITPIYETQLNPSNFKGVTLPGDAQQVTNGARLEYAWDNRLGWPYTSFTLQTAAPGNAPHMITFDLGVTAKLSRIWIRPYPEGSNWYYLSTMKDFEIYGSTSPNSGGALDNSWTLLGRYKVEKQGNPPTAYGKDNAADAAIASAGFNWDIRLDAPKVRFIRIRCLENFAGGTAQSINELKVYGDPR
jgi:hypothetical protein